MRALRLLVGVTGLGVLAWSGRQLFASGSQQPARTEPVRRARQPRPPTLPVPADPPLHAAEGVPESGSAGVKALRLVIGAVGLGVIAWGGWLLFGLGSAQWPSAGLWLAGGIVAHDALLAPLVVLLGVLLVRLAPAPAWAPLTVALIVWGSITLLAVPVLGSFGALSDNPTLLDRPYQMSWWILSAVVLAAVAVASVVRARRAPL